MPRFTRAARTSRAVRPRACLWLLCCLAGALGSPLVRAQETPDPPELLQQLNEVLVDPAQVYVLRNARITRDRVNIYFNRGFIGFFSKVAGEITGAVFVGEGEVLLIPPNPVEKRNLAQFIESPILAEQFSSAYLRFTDRTAQELLARARRPDPEDQEQPTGFTEHWNRTVRRLNPDFSMRVLMDLLGDRKLPDFHAQLQGAKLDVFQVAVDERMPEAVFVGAARRNRGRVYADLWCSFPSQASGARASWLRGGSVQVQSYKIDTRINLDHSLEGHAQLELESRSSTDRVLAFELSRLLKLSDVRDDSGQSLVVFQNTSLEESETAARGNDWVVVVLPEPYSVGKKFGLSFRYQGNVIAEVGNDVLYVGARGSWYPNRGLGARAFYDLTFHYPERLTLVATGNRVEETSSEGWTHSRWVSTSPVPVAGFNLGLYDSRTRHVGKTTIEVYAAREAEAPLEKRHVAGHPGVQILIQRLPTDRAAIEVIPKPVVPLDPTALLDSMAEGVAGAIQHFETLFGPFPYPRLSISQIPGHAGQGWPGLVYLPTLSFLTRTERSELGLGGKAEETQVQLSIIHEMAHQWWGNQVGWKTYHDQWLSEGFATCAAALYLTHEKGGERKLRELLQRYKADLLSKTAEGNTVESGGPIWLGQRLTNSRNPDGYANIVYKKACWVLHMLRALMTDPQTGSDERFFTMLRDFVVTYRDKDASTEDFIRHAEKYMTRSMDLERNRRLDWFFATWVYGTGIPTYKLEVDVRRAAPKKYTVAGTIEQSGVASDFEMLVPIVATYEKERKVTLGRVAVGDGGKKFRFTTTAKPARVAIDEENLLAVVK